MQADECHLLTSHHQPSAMPNRRHLFQVQQEAVVHRHKSESVQQVSRVSRRPSNYVSAPRHAMSHWTTSQMSSHPLQAVRDRAPSDKGCPSPRRTASQASNRPNRRSIHIQSTCNRFLFSTLRLFFMLDVKPHIHATGAVVAIGNAIMAVDSLRGLLFIVPIA